MGNTFPFAILREKTRFGAKSGAVLTFNLENSGAEWRVCDPKKMDCGRFRCPRSNFGIALLLSAKWDLCRARR